MLRFYKYLLLILLLSQSIEIFSADIIDGIGLMDVKLSEINSDEIIDQFGINYLYKNTREGYKVLEYKDLGLSFGHEYGDDLKIIHLIDIYAPFKGVTSKGISIKKSVLEDVVKLYGTPTLKPRKSWNGLSVWECRYDGISFYIKNDPNNTYDYFDENENLNKEIIGIRLQRRLKSENGENNYKYTDKLKKTGYYNDKKFDELLVISDLSLSYSINNNYFITHDFISISGISLNGVMFGFSLSQLDINHNKLNLSFLEISLRYLAFNIVNFKNKSCLYNIVGIKLRPLSVGYEYDNSNFTYNPHVILNSELVFGGNKFTPFLGIDYYIDDTNWEINELFFRIGLRFGSMNKRSFLYLF